MVVTGGSGAGGRYSVGNNKLFTGDSTTFDNSGMIGDWVAWGGSGKAGKFTAHKTVSGTASQTTVVGVIAKACSRPGGGSGVGGGVVSNGVGATG